MGGDSEGGAEGRGADAAEEDHLPAGARSLSLIPSLPRSLSLSFALSLSLSISLSLSLSLSLSERTTAEEDHLQLTIESPAGRHGIESPAGRHGIETPAGRPGIESPAGRHGIETPPHGVKAACIGEDCLGGERDGCIIYIYICD